MVISNQAAKILIPEEAIAEFEVVEKSDWSAGVGLDELVEWINWVADRFRPEEVTESVRSASDFSARSFRHYQTLGCIDKPERVGRKAVYGFRQYLQALVIRKLLWERVSSAQIVNLMEGKSNEELKLLLFEGIEIVASRRRDEETAPPATVSGQPEAWTRLTLAPGLEVHWNQNGATLDPEEIEIALNRLREHLSRRR